MDVLYKGECAFCVIERLEKLVESKPKRKYPLLHWLAWITGTTFKCKYDGQWYGWKATEKSRTDPGNV